MSVLTQLAELLEEVNHSTASREDLADAVRNALKLIEQEEPEIEYEEYDDEEEDSDEADEDDGDEDDDDDDDEEDVRIGRL